MKLSGQTILITGGGSGIGQALAHRLHDAGNTVIVAGRRRAALEQAVAGRERMHAVELDVTRVSSVEEFATRVLAEFPALNVLVNNAGIMRIETLDKRRDLADAEETITTNLLAPIRLIDAFVEHLTGQPDAAIINVSSGLAFVPMLATATYCATKAALHIYTVALREALKGQVEVFEIVPPGVQTELTPGQSRQEGFMPLDAFADEVMTLLDQQPTPPEILVEQVRFLRNAEAEARFDQTLAIVNTHHG